MARIIFSDEEVIRIDQYGPGECVLLNGVMLLIVDSVDEEMRVFKLEDQSFTYVDKSSEVSLVDWEKVVITINQ